jgi:predicted GH43/DUF377 family glycosyl hydrolase
MKSVSVLFILVLIVAFTLSSNAQIIWEKYENNPVLEKGTAGAWDDDNVGSPCVIKVDETYHMWYDGNYDNPGSKNNGTGHATSSDGLNWSKDILNPVFLPTAGSWDLAGITHVSVLFDDMESLFHMWYAGWSLPDNGFIGHATSVDGGHWLKDTLNNPVLSPGPPGSWDDLAIISACVIKVGGTYHMWYDVWQNGSSLMRIGHATSADGVSWEKDPNNPVLIPGNAGSWDYTDTRAVNVVFDGLKFHMLYTGGTWFHYDIGYAYSHDGSSWTKYNDTTTTNQTYAESDPVMKRGSIGNWDSWSLCFGSVMLNETKDAFKMWYSGSDNDYIDTRIGYATSQIVDGIDDASSIELPGKYVLMQNYPNPFNPSTTIEFSLPKSEFVELKVFNILGKKVATLISNKLNQGNHTYQFDGKNLASGIYYYQLVAGDYRQVKKMVLLR